MINTTDQIQIESLNNYVPFDWPTNDSAYKSENQSISYIIDYLSRYINNNKYQIRDVNKHKDFLFSIATLDTNFKGRPDAIIVPNNREDLERQARVIFEFKTNQAVFKPNQRKFQLIASYTFSLHPVMVVQTDLKNFFLLVGHNNTIYEYFSSNAKQSIEYINYWLNCICNYDPSFDENTNIDNDHKLYAYIQMMIHCRNKNNYYKNFHQRYNFIQTICCSNEKNEISNDQDKEKAEKIMNAYRLKSTRFGVSGRSGKCYKIEIDNQEYVLKLHKISSSNKTILSEMKREKHIYEVIKTKSEGNWPKLYYGGYLFGDNYYSICTNFIDGICYTSEQLNMLPSNELNLLKSYCLETIKVFHIQGIAHRDIRAPNIIFKDEKAFIIDFGFSKITNAQEYYDDDLIRLNGKIF